MSDAPVVFVVDDDAAVRDSLRALLEGAGFAVEAFDSAEGFLAAHRPGAPACLVLDVHMPGMSGLELQDELARRGTPLPVLFLTGHGDIPTSVRAVKAGAVDFLTKPADGALLVERVRAMLTLNTSLHERLDDLTERERQVMRRVAAGASNKEIARTLGISARTVEVHRARVMRKMRARSPVELAEILRTLGAA